MCNCGGKSNKLTLYFVQIHTLYTFLVCGCTENVAIFTVHAFLIALARAPSICVGCVPGTLAPPTVQRPARWPN